MALRGLLGSRDRRTVRAEYDELDHSPVVVLSASARDDRPGDLHKSCEPRALVEVVSERTGNM